MTKLHAWFASLILALPFTAQAIPITYDVTLQGGFGSGSFVYDAALPHLFDFSISFATFAGSQVTLRLIAQDGSAASVLFEILTGEDVGQARCSADDGACSFDSVDVNFDFEAIFARAGTFTQAEFIDRNGELVFAGGFVTQQRLVPLAEPAALALLGLGLLALRLVVLHRRGRLPGENATLILRAQGS